MIGPPSSNATTFHSPCIMCNCIPHFWLFGQNIPYIMGYHWISWQMLIVAPVQNLPKKYAGGYGEVGGRQHLCLAEGGQTKDTETDIVNTRLNSPTGRKKRRTTTRQNPHIWKSSRGCTFWINHAFFLIVLNLYFFCQCFIFSLYFY